MKIVSRHQHDKNRLSRIATVDSCFALVGARQHCVARICNASHVGVSKRFSRGINLAVYCPYTFFWLIRSLVDLTLVTLIVCGPLQLFSLSFIYFWAVGLSDPIRAF